MPDCHDKTCYKSEQIIVKIELERIFPSRSVYVRGNILLTCNTINKRWVERAFMSQPLFREKSIERLSTPEQLTDYIRVLRPGIWLTLVAAIVLLAALLVWGIYGAIPDAVSVNGAAKNGIVECYVANPANLYVGMEAKVNGIEATVTQIDARPLSQKEIADRYREDYVLHMLNVGDWSYRIEIKSPEEIEGLVRVEMVGNPVQPISFLMDEAA